MEKLSLLHSVLETFLLIKTDNTLRLLFCFFTKFDSFAGQLHHSGWRQT